MAEPRLAKQGLGLAGRIGIGAVLMVLAVVFAFFFSAGGKQQRGVWQAEKLRERVGQSVAADERFGSVAFSVSTHPYLRVVGIVPDSQALRDLQQMIVAPANALFSVQFQVRVAADDSLAQ